MNERKIPKWLGPREALVIVAARGCGKSTQGLGSCFKDGYDALSQYGADQVCDGCLAFAGLAQEPRPSQ